MIKRLIFHHQGKTGGSSFINWLNPSLSRLDYTCELEQNLNAKEIARACLGAEIIHIHGCILPLAKRIGEEAWEKIGNEAFKVTILRNPAKRMESEWSFFQDNKMGNFLPHIKTYCAEKGGLQDYFERNEEEQLNINEWITIYNRHHEIPQNCNAISDNNNSFLMQFDERSLGTAMELISSLNPYYQTSNFQIKQIETHLGVSFIAEAIKGNPNAIILATERMNSQIAKLCERNIEFRRFFEHIYDSKDTNGAASLEKRLNKNRDNVRSEKMKKQRPNKLTTKNEFEYCRINSKDYIFWGMAINDKFMGKV